MAIIGAILGDIAGSRIEFGKPKDYDYKTAELFTDENEFTDDTVLTIATKSAIDTMEFGIPNYAKAYYDFGLKYYSSGYGEMFMDWLDSENPEPYGSYGNGSAMRVSYVADVFNKYSDIQKQAERSAECTHDHEEGIKGAKVTVGCIWVAKNNGKKSDILRYGKMFYPMEEYPYSCEYSLDELRNFYKWSSTCQASVPLAIRCVYEADSYEEFLRNVFSFDCDTDTVACIGGGIAEELFGGTGLDNKAILKKYLSSELYGYVSELL